MFEPVVRGQHHLVLRYGVGDLRFSTTYWYDDVDFVDLEARHGADAMRIVYFHLLAFEANKAASLAPTEIDAGPYDDLVSDSFWGLWETLFRNVWAVWRFENDLPDYRLPRPPAPHVVDTRAAIDVDEGQTRLLMLCGGGKDSLASMKLLERAGIAYDTFIYSHSTYGRGEPQHQLIDALVDRCRPRRVHRAWVLDDALEAPIAAAYAPLGIRRIVAAETVSSYWLALPVALQHGFTEVALGITRSTDEHNLVWEKTGEPVNYLWGMSAAAEQLLHDYVQRELVSNLTMFHLLRPIYDVNVFALLRRNLDAVPHTHSCAQQKPWCCRCAKCLYVWMNYVAWLPAATVAATVDLNLFDLPENGTILRKMLGLESYKPTDCVGTVSEARLAFAMCRARGVGGAIAADIGVTDFVAEAESTLDHYATAMNPGPAYPPRLVEPIGSLLRANAISTREFALDVLTAHTQQTSSTATS
jgi:UDP-N-acetyl-alpha-D-muramoyl-L-alanyl-L-glutamate epimerase